MQTLKRLALDEGSPAPFSAYRLPPAETSWLLHISWKTHHRTDCRGLSMRPCPSTWGPVPPPGGGTNETDPCPTVRQVPHSAGIKNAIVHTSQWVNGSMGQWVYIVSVRPGNFQKLSDGLAWQIKDSSLRRRPD
jgi:hypothetical protein